jgi:hypothetical protein
MNAGEILAGLRANARRRQRAEAQLDAGRQELGELLAAGLEAGFTVTDMADFAQISRETAYAHIAKRGRGK